MNDLKNGKHVHEWLNAYHDGELRGRKLGRLEAHLAHCPECQQALAELDALSALLQADPLPQISTTPEQFIAQVGLRLPRQTKAAKRRPGRYVSQISWRWAVMPLGMLGMIWFLRAVSLVSGLLSGIEWLGINPNAVSWLVPSQSTPPNLVQSASLVALDWSVPFNMDIFIMLVLPLVFAGFYLIWLVLWWMDQENRKGLQTAGR